MSNIFPCNCSYENNVIVRSNCEYDYFGNVLEYEYEYFAVYSSMSTQNVLEYFLSTRTRTRTRVRSKVIVIVLEYITKVIVLTIIL